LFYRFGYTFIPKASCIEYGDLSDKKTKNSLTKLFAQITPFEYDEEYLILHLEYKTETETEVFRFEIQDIVAVYPLSEQAKVSIESKIDTRIRLENPVPEDILESVEKGIDENEWEKAINALWQLCGFNEKITGYVNKIGKENIFKGLEHRKNSKHAQAIRNGNYWEYLIAYDRYDYFPPNSPLGYFYDAGQLFAYSKEWPTFEGSALHKWLEKINCDNPEIKITPLIKALESQEDTQKYISQTTDGELKQYIIAPLYLLLRNEIRDADDISQTNIFQNQEWLKEEFGDSFKYVVILLGTFFGFRKFYDIYYDSLDLRFYRNAPKETKDATLSNVSEEDKKDAQIAEPENVNVKEVEEISTPTEHKESVELDSEEIREKLKNLKPRRLTDEKIQSIIEIIRKNGIMEKSFTEILKIPQIGPATLQKIRECLQQQESECPRQGKILFD
jgi:hypothetical protein